MSFDPSSFVSIGVLAWKVYISCKDAPESFGNIASEALSLHAVLKEAEETIFAQPLPPTQQLRLKAVGDGCHRVLLDLRNLVEKYEGLGTRGKRTCDRMRWHSENVAELRMRLISNTGLLNAWISSSQAHVEKKLNNYSREFREGKRQDSIITTQTQDSLATDEKQIWRSIRKELEEIGITVAAFDANREFICTWLSKAISSGAFEEKPYKKSPSEEQAHFEAPSLEEDRFQEPELFSDPWIAGLRTASSYERLEVREHDVPFSQPVAGSVPNLGHSGGATIMSSMKAFSGRKLLRSLPQVPRPVVTRLATLVTGTTRHNNILESAIQKENLSRVRGIILEESKVSWINKGLLRKALHFTASRGDEEAVQLLLKNSVDVNAGDGNDTALQSAAKNGHAHIVSLLLKEGAYIEAGSCTALWHAAWNGHEQIVHLLLENGASANASYRYIDSPLQLASQSGHEQIVELLLKNGADVNAHNGSRSAALLLASEGGHEQIVRLLLEEGADVKANNGDLTKTWTALHLASKGGHEQIVQLLLEKGADLSACDKFGNSALHLASEEGHQHVVQLLILSGGHINAYGIYGKSPLQLASEKGQEQIVRLLLESGADINGNDSRKRTPLHLAAEKGYEQIARLLLEQGADINKIDPWGETPLHLATDKGHEDMVRLLLKNGADINKIHSRLGTALCLATRRGLEQIIQLLLKNGADINASADVKNRIWLLGTPLEIATRKGNKRIIQLLLEEGALVTSEALEGARQNLEILQIIHQHEWDSRHIR